MNRRTLIVAALLAVGTCWARDAALAQPLEHGRGNIVSIDQDRATVELRDPKNRVTTWRFQRDAKVKFTDGAAHYPRPSVRDLRPPMYVHYTFLNEVIVSFDVAELGFRPGDADTGGKYKQQGVPRTVTGRVSAYDPSVRQVAVEHHGLTEAFQLTDRSDRKLDPGMRVELRTDWSGQRELVSELRVLPAATTDDSSVTGDTARRRRPRAYNRGEGQEAGREGDASGSAEGRVVRISTSGVLMEVGGTRETYAVASSRLLSRLRVGQTVGFDWEDRDGKLVITSVR